MAGRTVATAGACNTTVGTGDTGAAGEAKAEAEAEAEAARQRLRAERGWLTAAHTVAIVGGGIGGLATALALLDTKNAELQKLRARTEVHSKSHATEAPCWQCASAWQWH